LAVLIGDKVIEPREIVWIAPTEKKEGEDVEEEDDMVFVEDYFRMMA